jgi:hypothetical protein
MNIMPTHIRISIKYGRHELFLKSEPEIEDGQTIQWPTEKEQALINKTLFPVLHDRSFQDVVLIFLYAHSLPLTL